MRPPMNDRRSETARSRCRARPAAAQGAQLQRLHGAAGDRRGAARALRSGEMGADHGQLAAAAHGVRAQRRGQGAARAGAVVAEPEEDAGRAGGGDPRLRHALLRAPAAAVPQSAGAKLVRDHAGGDPHHGAAQRHLAGRLSDAGGARASGSTAARCRASRTTRSTPRSSPTAASSRISCAASATAIRRPCRSRTIASASTRCARSCRRAALPSTLARAWRGSAAPGIASQFATSPVRSFLSSTLLADAVAPGQPLLGRVAVERRRGRRRRSRSRLVSRKKPSSISRSPMRRTIAAISRSGYSG